LFIRSGQGVALAEVVNYSADEATSLLAVTLLKAQSEAASTRMAGITIQ